MKIVSYHTPGGLLPGIIHGDAVVDLNQALAAVGLATVTSYPSVRSFLTAHGRELTQLAGKVVPALEAGSVPAVGPTAEVRLGPPIPNPEKVLCVGLNYSDHVGETGRVLPTHTDLFAKFASSLIGPHDDISRSDVSSNLDYEGELAIVIGRTCTQVSTEQGLEYVAGISIINDITARDLQYRGTQWLAGKALDSATPFGPTLVTLDEVGDPNSLDISTTVNGITVQSSNTRNMIFPIAHVVSYVSQFLTLSPGDVIATGTPEGIGAKKNPPVWLRAGDVVSVRLDNVGTLTNAVV